jgi:hypothetical protein
MSMHSYSWYQMEMSGQLQAPANFIAGMHVTGSSVGLRARLHVMLIVFNTSKAAGSLIQLGNKFRQNKQCSKII